MATLRADDLAALPIKSLMERNPSVDWAATDDLIYGCANQAGEDNRNVARMAALLAGLPVDVPAATVNRLCGSSLDAVAMAARAIKAGEGQLLIAGGVESMTRAPFVVGKADSAFSRAAKMEDTTLGWRFINPVFKAQFGVDSMPETGENVAEQFGVSRADQDAFAARSQDRYFAALERGFFAPQLLPVAVHKHKGETHMFVADEQPRAGSTVEVLSKLKPVVKPDGTVTAGNASSLNDGAAAVLLASEAGARKHGLIPRARIVAASAAGVFAAHHGLCARARDAQGPRTGGAYAGADGYYRTQRSLCRTSAGRHARSRSGGRRSPREPEWRRDRHWTSARRFRCKAGDYGFASARSDGRPLRAVHDVYRRGPGPCPHTGTRLANTHSANDV